MAKLEGNETNANSYMQDLQMLQDAQPRPQGAFPFWAQKGKAPWGRGCKMLLEDATSWLQLPDTTVRYC